MAFENWVHVFSVQISRSDRSFHFPGSSWTGRVKHGETLSWLREGMFYWLTFCKTCSHSRHCLQVTPDLLSLVVWKKKKALCFSFLSGSLRTRELMGRKWLRRRTSCQNTSGWRTYARKQSTRPPVSSQDRYLTGWSQEWKCIKVLEKQHGVRLMQIGWHFNEYNMQWLHFQGSISHQSLIFNP